MKIFNVKGEMFDISRDCSTQDIEFNGVPATKLADAEIAEEILDYELQFSRGACRMNTSSPSDGDGIRKPPPTSGTVVKYTRPVNTYTAEAS
ncbi:hypothetical protein F5Y05DRAFT_408308 [Hypoxylon sp. FL0543]|nr:hypothetical protein F5Y05DRAFT_408308 [Hypoxylon sp. FL0543]